MQAAVVAARSRDRHARRELDLVGSGDRPASADRFVQGGGSALAAVQEFPREKR